MIDYDVSPNLPPQSLRTAQSRQVPRNPRGRPAQAKGSRHPAGGGNSPDIPGVLATRSPIDPIKWVNDKWPALRAEVIRQITHSAMTNKLETAKGVLTSDGRKALLSNAASNTVNYLGGRSGMTPTEMSAAAGEVARKVEMGIGIASLLKSAVKESESLNEALDELDGASGRHLRSGYQDSRFDGEDNETGWEVAARRLGGRPAGPTSTVVARPGASAAGSLAVAQASAARKRIRPAVAPAFANAIDTAVNPELILGYVRKRGGTPDLPGLRNAWVATAAKHFAAEFVRTIGSAPKGTSENLALGAIIASALAQTGQQFPLVPPAAVPAMSVLIHKTLQPRLAALARMAATIAAAPPARSAAAAMHELAW